MTQLLLETATDVCSVAVARDGVILAEHTAKEVYQHASHLTVFIRDVMASAGVEMVELDEVVLSDGPGSFTSLRVGAATAKGLCMALPGLKLRVVPTLLSLAVMLRNAKPTLTVINSRRGEVYGQLFGARTQVQGENKKAGWEEALWSSPQNIRLTEDEWFEKLNEAAGGIGFNLSGPGQQRVQDHLPEGVILQGTGLKHCSARLLLAPASAPEGSRLVDVATYEPFYLNPPFVTVSKKKPLG
ncbi:tRNA (adenosine(37)-N6)-threonylcarbamoyltransferase complex dimerization subunit type 1 TsaB [Neolewinella agarilytica]|uniref:tRNA threonylcarbamoyladenosine biosynthesis protein TsaB n=1 Tax=Neolewinella agarilytica TaxID=478744 RepID=A0A1H9PB49_9BACT|nr:tRNA (adenosine(37)-N6)-threonylcarbamoyltransferase complex dimerization subunit type 1 TsaB [Neolewinella agarilytica]SER45381.1 tRNA threonylcarbamoyladenosine biosynthesis protein TsaB [Neolewinella agarilytica]